MHSKFDYEAFLELARKLTEDQYDFQECDYRLLKEEKESIAAEKIERAKRAQYELGNDKVVDFTDIHPDHIMAKLEGPGRASNAKVGTFLLKIYRGSKISFHLYEVKGNMHCTVQKNDKRFKEADCIQNFNGTLEDIVCIIRWLQMADKALLYF